MVQTLFGRLREHFSFFYLFLSFSLGLLIALGVLYSQFEKRKDEIIEAHLKSDLSIAQDIAQNLQRALEQLPAKDLVHYFSLHPKLFGEFSRWLSLVSGQKVKYIYLLAPHNDHFVFLADGSKEDKASFKERYEPLHPEYFTDSPKYFFHKEIHSLWMSYVAPIVVDGKIAAYLVEDFSMSDFDLIRSSLFRFQKTYENMIWFILVIIASMVVFAFFDQKREKERKAAYAKLRELNASLEKRIQEAIEENRQKDVLLYEQAKLSQMGEMVNMIAHQWRQPLNSISVAAITLDMKCEMGECDPKFIKEKATFIQKTSQEMSQTINDFMNFAKKKRKFERVSMKQILLNVEKMIGAQLKHHQIDLRIFIEEDCEIFSIPNDIQHIVINLLTNAKDALDEIGKEEKKIDIRVFSKDGECHIQVADNGPGIAPENVHRVFEPYFTTKEQGKGTGLGLYIAKKIAQEHLRGDLELLKSEEGALFDLHFPMFDSPPQ